MNILLMSIKRKKNKKVGERTNALSEEIAKVKMRSPSLVNTDYFLSDYSFQIFHSLSQFQS